MSGNTNSERNNFDKKDIGKVCGKKSLNKKRAKKYLGHSARRAYPVAELHYNKSEPLM